MKVIRELTQNMFSLWYIPNEAFNDAVSDTALYFKEKPSLFTSSKTSLIKKCSMVVYNGNTLAILFK